LYSPFFVTNHAAGWAGSLLHIEHTDGVCSALHLEVFNSQQVERILFGLEFFATVVTGHIAPLLSLSGFAHAHTHERARAYWAGIWVYLPLILFLAATRRCGIINHRAGGIFALRSFAREVGRLYAMLFAWKGGRLWSLGENTCLGMDGFGEETVEDERDEEVS